MTDKRQTYRVTESFMAINCETLEDDQVQSVSLVPGDIFEIQSGINDPENDYHGAFVTSKIGRLQIENEDIFNHAAPITPEEYDKEADPFR